MKIKLEFGGDMEKKISEALEVYKRQLAQGDIQRAYMVLMRYMGELRANFPEEYKIGNISFGYLDYTYFPFSNEYLRSQKLRFGIVLNHQEMQFELWLMGQNESLQKEYWNKLKDSKWNEGVSERPQYSVLEVCLNDNIDFENKNAMTKRIFEQALQYSEEIQEHLKQIN